MKRKLFIALAAALPMLLQAAPLTPDQALSRLGGSSKAKAAVAKGGMRLVHTQKRASGDPAVYLFNSGNAGYLVVAADDAVTPLLGYSDNGRITDELPVQMQEWIEEYARQIEYASKNNAPKPKGDLITIDRPEREAVDPMIKTQWDQDEPYYNMCPMYGVDRTYTGCVATAMAQVMNYHKYPVKGTGSISYDAETIQKRLELNFSLRKFDWDNMLESYDKGYSQEEADAVAYLMKACGYAVKMDYGVDSSGALSMYIPRALKKYFGYDQGVRQTFRQYYSLSEWEEIIYKELQEGRPILYGGGSMLGGGHSFVCDGYDKDGYFHFNWGWKGMSNGYFLLDALNPYALGTGGGSGGGYNFTQDVVIGIQAPVANSDYVAPPVTMSQNGSLAGNIKNGILYFDLFAENGAMFVNYEPTKLKFQFGAIIEKDGEGNEDFEPRGIAMLPRDASGNIITDSDGKPLTEYHFSIDPGYGIQPTGFNGGIKLSDLNLEDGTYKVTSAILLDDEGSEWTPTVTGREYYNYLYLTKKGSRYSVEVMSVDRLSVVDGGFRGELYYGCSARTYVTVYNDADHELTRGFAPAIIVDGEPVMLGESIYLTVPAKATVTRDWTTPMYTLSQYFAVGSDKQVTLTFFDESTYNFFMEDLHKTITLHANPGAPNIALAGAPVIENGIKRKGLSMGSPIYDMETPGDVIVKADVKLNSGYFGYPVYGVIVNNEDNSVANYTGYDMFFDEPGTTTFRTTIPFGNAEKDKMYTMMIGFAYGNQLYSIPGSQSRFVFLSNYADKYAGVEDIASNAAGLTFANGILRGEGKISVYNAGGMIVAEGEGSVDTNSLAAGIYVARCGGKTVKVIK